MGIALKVPGIDFSGANLGRVTPADPTILTSIDIVGADAAYGEEQYTIAYTPAGTTHTGVSWSIVSGGNYASIDQDGVLTPTSGVGQVVRIQATSTYDASIIATKDVVVTYLPDWVKPNAGFMMSAKFQQTGITPAAVDTIKVVVRYKIYQIPGGWAIGSRSSTKANSTDMVCVAFPNSIDYGNVMLGATDTGNFLPKTLNTDFLLEFDKDGVTLNGEPRAWLGSVGNAVPSRVIHIGGINAPTPLDPAAPAGIVLNKFQIYTNGVLTTNIMPYYVSSTDYGLYDLLQDKKLNGYQANAVFFEDYDTLT